MTFGEGRSNSIAACSQWVVGCAFGRGLGFACALAAFSFGGGHGFRAEAGAVSGVVDEGLCYRGCLFNPLRRLASCLTAEANDAGKC